MSQQTRRDRAEPNRRVQRVTTVQEIDKLEQDWIRLHNQAQTSFFTSWHWCRLWWANYGDLGTLYIIVVRVDDVVRGIAPFYVCDTTSVKLFQVTTLRFIGSGGDTSPDDLDIICAPEHRHEVVTAVCKDITKNDGVSRIHLTDIPAESELVGSLSKALKGARWTRPIYQYHSRLVDDLPGSTALFEQQLSRNSRKQKKRRLKRLHSAGKVHFTMCSNVEQVEESFKHLQRLHTLRHQSKGQAGKFASTPYCRFHLSLMKRALERDELRLLQLSVDNTVIGVEYAFLSNQVLCFFQTGFDPEYQHLSPGHLLIMHSIDAAIEQGAKQIDLLKGNYDYKQSYAKQKTQSVDIDVQRHRTLHFASRAIRRLNRYRKLAFS